MGDAGADTGVGLVKVVAPAIVEGAPLPNGAGEAPTEPGLLLLRLVNQSSRNDEPVGLGAFDAGIGAIDPPELGTGGHWALGIWPNGLWPRPAGSEAAAGD